MSAIDQAFIRAYEIDEGPAPSAAATVDVLPPPPPISREPRSAHPSPLNTAPAPSATAPSATAPHFHRIDPPAASPPTGKRRPLSSFAAPHVVDARFRPSLEVDAFRFSDVCNELTAAHKPLWRAALHNLLAADDEGRSLIGVGAAAPGAGATTAVLCLARLLAEAGKTIAIVDGNFANAGLAPALGMAVDTGWEDVLAGRAPLAEAVIYSNNDRIACLPLVAGGMPAAANLASIHASVSAGVLRYHYDMVLFDLGALSQEFNVAGQIARQCRLDAFALVAGDARALPVERLKESTPELAALCLGVIENGAA